MSKFVPTSCYGYRYIFHVFPYEHRAMNTGTFSMLSPMDIGSWIPVHFPCLPLWTSCHEYRYIFHAFPIPIWASCYEYRTGTFSMTSSMNIVSWIPVHFTCLPHMGIVLGIPYRYIFHAFPYEHRVMNTGTFSMLSSMNIVSWIPVHFPCLPHMDIVLWIPYRYIFHAFPPYGHHIMNTGTFSMPSFMTIVHIPVPWWQNLAVNETEDF
jgi:hypothetical protein